MKDAAKLPPGWPQLWADHDRQLKGYLFKQRVVGVGGTVAEIAWVLWLLLSGSGLVLQGEAFRRFDSPVMQWLFFFGVVGATFKLVNFPFSYAHYWLEKERGLSKQSLGSWLGDQAKGIAVGVVLGGVVLLVLQLCAASQSGLWWLGMWAFLVSFSVLLAQLAPVILLPLFIKMKPMEPGELKSRLLELAERFDVKVKEVFHLGLGEKTEKGNAAFMGLGRTKRIVIGDTLYERFPVEEVEAVFAHELGHQVHHDLWKGLALSSLLLAITLGLSDAIFWSVQSPAGGPWAPNDLANPYPFFVFLVIWTLVQRPFGVGQAIYSRSREWAADRFASQRTGMAAPLGSALERLTLQNQGLFRPNRVWEFLTYSHPAPWRRILALRA